MPDPIRKTSLSRAAGRMLAARPELAAELEAPGPFTSAEIAAALAGAAGDDEQALRRRLRRLRQRVFLRTMARDLEAGADLAEVCGTLSELAEQEIRTALDWLGAPDLVVVAMGKLGGRELNVSSDVDLVFVHPTGEDPERLERVGRKLIALLNDLTEDGIAFRVDMRLRPYGNSGPLVSGFDALEAYFLAQGREWERYAWIKARPVSGRAHAALEAIVRPFVYRKYLDYAALAAMRRLHTEVRREVERRDLADDVKLGPGGIREIEFVVQVLQLIRGGRDPALQVRPTLEALSALGERRLLGADALRELAVAYVFLRRLEHRLQYLDDAQRHRLPAEDEDRERLARMMDFADWRALAAAIERHREAVTRHFRDLLGEEPAEADLPWPEHPRAAALRSGQRYAQLPDDSRRRVDVLVPLLARAARATADPDRTLARGIDLVEAIAGRAAYLALLAEHPQALERVARIVGASPWAADYLARHPLLLDELLDDRLLYAPPDAEAVERALRGALEAAADDTERRMNLLREHHHAQVFRLLAQDLAGLLTVERLADHLSELADRVLGIALECAWGEVKNRHRERPRFAIIGYGKLGGKELGYASDLDMVFLYDDPDPRAEENYVRLAQRLNVWLTATTSSGQLFETDLALRPSGSKGLLVSSLAGFERYQEQSAWVWEHQALTRARYCAGERAIGERFEEIRVRILRRSRDRAALAREVRAMREKIHAAHPNRSTLFDLKHDRGGMIDIEFVVQYLVLAESCRHPRLVDNLGNIALLGIAAELGLVEPALAARCRDAYREFRRLQHALRLSGEKYARVPPERVAEQVAAVRELWRGVLEG
jgi:glutamate-ammonia-ligase adenylyltransferase